MLFPICNVILFGVIIGPTRVAISLVGTLLVVGPKCEGLQHCALRIITKTQPLYATLTLPPISHALIQHKARCSATYDGGRQIPKKWATTYSRMCGVRLERNIEKTSSENILESRITTCNSIARTPSFY